jgi:hypothetical protein
VILADIGARLAGIAAAAVAAGELPAAAGQLSAAGTWRPAPAGSGGGPGTYATSLPFLLAGAGGGDPARLAGLLADRLPGAGIARAAMTGGGYLTVTVSDQALAALAPRVVAAGPACAASDALRGTTLAAPPGGDLAAAPDWPQAWQLVASQASARLAERAGATITFDAERGPPASPAAHAADAGPGSCPRGGEVDGLRSPGLGLAAGGGGPAEQPGRESPVAATVGWLGADAVRYELARTAASRATQAGARLRVPHGVPAAFATVRGAHADAAGTLRWAAERGLRLGEPRAASAGLLAGSGLDPGDRGAARAGSLAARRLDPEEPGAAGTVLLGERPERELLAAISWLPERVAGAARRQRPAELAAYLEHLAGCWLDCQDGCPALPFRGRLAARSAEGAVARLSLAAAARTALAAGLGLLGVAAPERR